MKFAFTRRETIETIAWFEAPTEREAWGRAIDTDMADRTSDAKTVRKPVFRRAPDLDEKSWDEVFADKQKTEHGTFVTREYDL